MLGFALNRCGARSTELSTEHGARSSVLGVSLPATGGDICPQAQGRAVPRDSSRGISLAEERRPVNLQPRQLASSICEHGTTADMWPTGAG